MKRFYKKKIKKIARRASRRAIKNGADPRTAKLTGRKATGHWIEKNFKVVD